MKSYWTSLFGPYWENVDLVFSKFMDLACGSVHKLAKKETPPIFSQYGSQDDLTLVQ